MTFAVVAALSLLLQSSTVQPNAPSAKADVPAFQDPRIDVAKGVFYDKDLDLRFKFPPEMKAFDAEVEAERGHEAIYGEQGEKSAEHRESIRCTRPLLDLQLTPDNAPKRNGTLQGLWIDDSQEAKKADKPSQVYARMLFIDFDKTCAPKEMQKDENALLGNLALGTVDMPGMERIGDPLWIEVGKQKIHLDLAAGRPSENGKLASNALVMMGMSAKWHGHYLAWMYLSNDLDTFNKITKSEIQFGKNAPAPMFKADVTPHGIEGMHMSP